MPAIADGRSALGIGGVGPVVVVPRGPLRRGIASAGEPFEGVSRQALRGVDLAVGPDPPFESRDLPRGDQVVADLGNEFAADAEFSGVLAIRSLRGQPEPDLQGPASLLATQRQAVRQVRPRGIIEGVDEAPPPDHRGDRRPLPGQKGSVAMEAVGEQPLPIHLEDRDRGEVLEGVGVPFDRFRIESVAQVQVRVEHDLIDRKFPRIHRPPSPAFDPKRL